MFQIANQSKGAANLLFALVAAIILPLEVFGAGPAWWYQDSPEGNPAPVKTTGTSDYAAVNQGQLKTMAAAGVAELDAHFPGGAGDVLHGLVNAWTTPTAKTNDFNTVNLGQLKALTQPFFDRLLSGGYQARPLESGTYPWIGGAANDYAIVNIGQVKSLFSFDLPVPPLSLAIDADQNGLPDSWENQYFGNTGVNPKEIDSSDELNYWEDYVQGRTPNKGAVQEASVGAEPGAPGGAVNLQVFTPLK